MRKIYLSLCYTIAYLIQTLCFFNDLYFEPFLPNFPIYCYTLISPNFPHTYFLLRELFIFILIFCFCSLLFFLWFTWENRSFYFLNYICITLSLYSIFFLYYFFFSSLPQFHPHCRLLHSKLWCKGFPILIDKEK